MNHLIVEKCPPWDGQYEIPSFVFTNRELNRIKEISGVRGGELLDALVAEDAAAFVALAVVVLGRHGKNAHPDDLWDAERTAIKLEIGDGDDGDADNPPLPSPEDEQPNEQSVSSDSSGTPSEDGGE